MSAALGKYHNRKINTNYGKFDSRKELNRFRELSLLQRAGEISGLQRQVRFELIPASRDEEGRVVERACYYIADFVYMEKGNRVVEDAKGVRTKEYIIKRKLMLWVHNIKIQEV